MPELPEVEEVRRTLDPVIVGKRVAAVHVARKDFVTPRGAPLERLVGHTFAQTMRHGKKLFCVMDDSQTILIHLGMSGRIDCTGPEAKVEKHTHVIITLDSGTQVRLRDPRRFGGLWHYRTLGEALDREVRGHLGPDALNARVEDFVGWRHLQGKLKARLLSQRDVAGLGNIYVDEALWIAQLHPVQLVRRLRPVEIQRLVDAIGTVLKNAIASGGTTLRDYRNVSDQPGTFARQLQAYGRGNLPCKRCGTALKRTEAGGRTTVYCTVCQRRH
jgi:formamidopyrimidine-DNA glycosylase